MSGSAAEVDGADIASLRVDASGVTVDDQRLTAVRPAAPPVDVVRRVPGTVRRLEVVAHPASVRGVPAEVDVAASDVRFDWVVGADDQLYVEVREPSDTEPVVGTARIAVAHRDLVAAVRTVLAGSSRTRASRSRRSTSTCRTAGRARWPSAPTPRSSGASCVRA